MILASAPRRFSERENIIIQFFFFAVGVGASYVFGKASARASAIEMLKPHARSAFRRLLWLYYSFFRVAHEIERSRGANSTSESDEAATNPAALSQYAALKVMVVDQIEMGKHAIEDWRDIIPEDVEDVEERQKEDVQTMLRREVP